MSRGGTSRPAPQDDYDVVVVGAGMGGLYTAHRVLTIGLTVRVLEAGAGVGGTWYWNRYPGARCDVASVDYSFSFSEELQNEWSWKERYAGQPELEAYFNHVADRFGIREHIDFETRVESARYDADRHRWFLRAGDRTYGAQFVVMATGPLSVAYGPTFEGTDDFAGQIYHSADWPEGVDLTGKRVGVVGTGSTGIQMIPLLAEVAEHLTVFQRTANYSVPARNRPMSEQEMAEVRATYAKRRDQARRSRAGFPPRTPPISENSAMAVTEQQRREVYELMWEQGGGLAFRASFSDLLTNRKSNDTASEFIREKIRQVVKDPATAETLVPHDHPYATKRPPVDTNYYETFNRPDVTLVDLRETPIERLTSAGVQTSDRTYELDVLVLATGFDAVTGSLSRIEVEGRDGVVLKDKWKDGPRGYLGMAIAGLPNFFTVNGPGSPAAFTNMATHTEQNVEWITDFIGYLVEHRIRAAEPRPEAEDAWTRRMREAGEKTLYPEANSWYVGANIPGKPRVFMFYVDGFDVYSEECDRVARSGYSEFTIFS
ncbi:NAD(P)/FAD-dependent oxidoreductase [Pseudonocardia xishanensis]|uniref:NAD(P)/FAD-dependent oxidoreductase n=1 Tax=Pseudonocardia xishanensis TaxID=630995 RepID=A0ABP8RVY4_9PSEU